MIPGDNEPTHALPGGRTTLDDLFRRAGVRHPDGLALVDPADREQVMSGDARRMTYAEVDRAISAIAGRLQRLGVAPGSIVGIQIPHTVESVITLLAVLRAGLVAAPLPLLWRRAEMTTALTRLGARVLIAGGTESSAQAAEVAAAVFPIRYVCGFGEDLPEGVIDIHDLLSQPMDGPSVVHNPEPAASIAVITWDVTPEGLVPVARSQAELIAAGLAVLLEARPPEDAVILSTCPCGTLAGLALGPLLWLLTGGTLVLHQPFDASGFAKQCREENCDTLVLPGPLAASLAQADHLHEPDLRRVLALWRAPERVATAAPCDPGKIAIIDVLSFGETGLLAARREADGRPVPIPQGQVMAPRGASGAVLVAETGRSVAGTLMLGGPMVPRKPWPTGVERTGEPHLKPDDQGRVDTFHACRAENGKLSITSPPPGIVSVGGYRILLRDLQSAVNAAEPGAGVAALPDALGGHRLAGEATDSEAIRTKLTAAGLNSLLIDAFRDRRDPSAA